MTMYVGIDYGSVRCGIATADTELRIASPRDVVSTSDLIDVLMKMQSADSVQCVVMGHSKDFAGEDNAIMESARVAATEIETTLQVPVYFHDERLSSVGAAIQLNTLNADRGRKPKKEFELDASAATIILQSYLDSNQTSNDQGTH